MLEQVCRPWLLPNSNHNLSADDILNHLQEQIDCLREQRSRLSIAEAETVQQSELQLSQLVEEIVRSRRRREVHFDGTLFGEPAWDMLLEAYAADIAQVRIATSKLCHATAVPYSTAQRWLIKLVQEGWLQREQDRFDVRRSWVSLTSKAKAAMEAYLRNLRLRTF